ncbi:MAG: hypothetical protein MUF43_00275 [Flavobacterium sp.]|jgi:hypothetical protein|nr:hypothetical protein [Flavobacterium sp.]
MNLVVVLQAVNIEEKIKQAPDKGYEIGVVIGSYLPFVFLVILAYLLYYFSKNRNHSDKENPSI